MNFTKYVLILAISILSVTFVNAAGEVDTSFNPSLASVQTGSIKRIFVQPDGKILVSGYFKSVNGKGYSGIARLNADGSVDDTFTPPNLYNNVSGYIQNGGDINAIAMQSDGKILIGGNFAGYNYIPSTGILRLNQNGIVDSSFVSVGVGIVTDIKVFPDNKFLVARGNLKKFNSDGTLDTSSQINFNSANAISTTIQPDGSVIVAHQDMLRYDPNGIFDNSFLVHPGFIAEFNELISQPDGKILGCGTFTTLNGFPIRGIVRVNPNGTIDSTFLGNTNGPNGNVRGMALLPNGKILIAGEFTSYAGIARNKLALLNVDGSLDTSFDYSTNSYVKANDIDFMSNGKIIIGGDAVFIGQSALTITESNGVFSFNHLVSNSSFGHRLAIQSDGKIVAGGSYSFANNSNRKSIARFNTNGTLDTSFNSTTLNNNALVKGIVIQPDGNMVIGGSSTGRVWLSPTGNLNNSSPLNFIRDIKQKADGKIIIVGENFVHQYSSNMVFDSAFSFNVDAPVTVASIQPDGKILIGGEFSTVRGVSRGKIARINTDGTLDTTFNPVGGANIGSNIFDLELQSDGKILVGGSFSSFAFNSSYQRLIRLNSDGSVDNSFTSNVNSTVLSIKLQPNGKILIGGAFFSVSNVTMQGIARLNSNGILDTTFNVGKGTNGNVWDVELQSDGKVVYVGDFTLTNGISTLGIGRLLNDNVNAVRPAPFDFDGDGKSNITVFRPSNRFWYGLNSSNSAFTQFNFGAVGDVLTPADYNFDGKCDIAIFRPSSGQWWYQAPTGLHTLAANWGQAGDKPIPSDWDGDGKSDFIVYRPSNGVWYRLSSGNGQMSFAQFGIAEDLPLQADFDGDGKSDLAVYRPSTGTWYWLNSSNGQFAGVPFGTTGDIPQAGDFDGDGKTDFAVYRPSNGYWYFLYSGTNYSFGAIPFGLAEDRPTVADYDGDGKTDIAVFRPSSGTWYLLQSQTGFAGIAFGTSGDIPIPSAYYP